MKTSLYLLNRALPLLAVIALAVPQLANAQSSLAQRVLEDGLEDAPDGTTATSGTLASQASSNWTAAPWMITGGPGTYPDGGGTATFNTVTNNVIGTVAGGIALTLDVPITLSGVTYNTPYTQNIAGTNSLIMAASGANFNVQLSAQNTPTLFTLTNVISAPISGGGTSGLTKTGTGILTLTGANTYTGGTHINGGTLVLSATAAIGDSVLGATGTGNGISFDNGILLNNVTGGLTTGRDVVIGAGGATIRTFTALTLNGIISGSGSLRREITNAALTLSGANTYTGTTTNTAGTLNVNGANGTIATSSGYDLGGTINLDSSAANNNNRISDTAAITSRGATFTLTGNASAATAEVAGALNLTNGNTTITVTPNAAQAASLSFSSINRLNNSTLFVRGTNLGSTAAAGVASIRSTSAPGTLIGGGGAAGTTNQSILPYAIGNTSATATLGSTHVTYDSVSGNLRPLLTSEYATALGGNPTDNVRLTAATVAPSESTVNALLFAPAAAATLSGGMINITSGSFLYSPTVSSTGTVSANLNFGAAEGFIHTSNTLNISGVISGGGGLTINPFAGSTVTLSGASNYTGTTTLLGGTTAFGGVVASGAPSVFGSSTSAIVMNVGTASTILYANATGSVLNRDLIVSGNPSVNVLAEFGVTGTQDLTMNGSILLNRTLSIGGSSVPITLNGLISGTGGLTERFSSLVVLNNNNTFSGGTNIQTGTFAAGVNSTATTGAFGTGTIFFSGAGGTIRSADTAARTISNNIFIGSALSATAASNPTFGGAGALNFTGNVDLNGSRAFNVTNSAPTTFTGNIGNGSLTKFGIGFMALNNPNGNTYAGGTVLGASAGTLNVNNTTGSGTGAGTVSIGTGSTLSGNFAISGAVQVAGTLSPGNSAGTANFGSSLTLTSTATTLIEIASASSFDRINVAGLLTLAGNISIMTIGGYDAPVGTTFDIIDFGSINATGFNLANISFTNQPGSAGTMLDTSNFLINGSVTVVPEPSTYALLATGVLFAGFAYRRRLRAQNS